MLAVRLALDELAQIRCVADGLLEPTLTVHALATDGDQLALVDPEGVPVASLVVTRVADGLATGNVTVLAPPTAATYPGLRPSPQAVAASVTGRGEVIAFVGVHGPHPDEIAAVAATHPTAMVLGLAVAGGVRPDDPAHHRAIHSWLAFRDSWRGPGDFQLILTPLWATADSATLGAAARAYGATETVLVAPRPADTTSGGATVFFTGLSGSGKSTVAAKVVAVLTEQYARTVTLLDGDVVRTHLSSELGFSRADRDLNIRRIGWVAAEVTKHGGLAVAAPIAPYRATRADVRAMVEQAGGPGSFVLVHISTPLAECERRDRKGLYAKARRGEIAEFTGISDPYEEPADAALTIDTTHIDADAAAEQVVSALRSAGKL